MTSLIVTPQDVRDYLALNQDASASRYRDSVLIDAIAGAQSDLEQWTHRYLADHPEFETRPWAATTLLRAQVPLPGFRTVTSCSWGGATISLGTPGNDTGASGWLIPDVQQTGVYTALQFRAWRADGSHPWWLADSGWFDKALDSKWFPGNWGGGYAWTSMPNDLVIRGTAGYATGEEPPAVRQAVKVLAAYYTLRPVSLLAGIVQTPSGPADLSALPVEVANFVNAWKIGQQAVSVG